MVEDEAGVFRGSWRWEARGEHGYGICCRIALWGFEDWEDGERVGEDRRRRSYICTHI